MKKRNLMKQNKHGYIGIETIIIAGTIVIIGLIAMNNVFSDSLKNIIINGVKPTIDNLVE